MFVKKKRADVTGTKMLFHNVMRNFPGPRGPTVRPTRAFNNPLMRRFLDSDRDGVPNNIDCRPFNRQLQITGESKIPCPNCRTLNPAAYDYCYHCKKPMKPGVSGADAFKKRRIQCSRCGNLFMSDLPTCPHCGKANTSPSTFS